MLSEENEVYGPYAPSYQHRPFESVAVLEDPPVTHAPAEQDTSPLPSYPPGSKTPAPQYRPGRGGAILLLVLILALIFGVVQPRLRRRWSHHPQRHPVAQRLKLRRKRRLQR